MTFDVIVVGGGVVGCAVARELSRYHLRVGLVEREVDVGFGTTKANSGIIHAGHHGNPGSLKGRLEWRGNQAWDELHVQLGFGFKRVGELTVAFGPEEERSLAKLKAQGEAKGVPGLEFWDSDRLRREEPNLTPDITLALLAPTAGVINPYEAAFSMRECAEQNGARFLLGREVTGLREEDGAWTVRTYQETLRTRFVVNCAGLAADRVADLAGAGGFRLVARKGEEYLLDKRLQGFVKRIVFPTPTPTTKGILVIPTFDGTIMVGPTAHVTDREDLTTTPDGAAEVFAAVRRLAPGITERDCIAEFAGLRAVLESEDFLIEPSRRRGFINVAGIQSPGLTASPAIAETVAEILGSEGLSLEERDDFQPVIPRAPHFAALPPGEQGRLADREPGYRRLVCRCETITEAEVRAAVRRGATTLDGVKFRTRAGMGRCQGGFCTTRVLQLLAEDTGVPFTALTKRGPGTWLTREREPEALPQDEKELAPA
ncbi:MAG TPA: NAD(P)/FAD-dependent oxidoreductase [Deinococcales bacterium]|nr:NAD(P)/FAD-dependent oxidoreductase [Deinococcales bacterium]